MSLQIGKIHTTGDPVDTPVAGVAKFTNPSLIFMGPGLGQQALVDQRPKGLEFFWIDPLIWDTAPHFFEWTFISRQVYNTTAQVSAWFDDNKKMIRDMVNRNICIITMYPCAFWHSARSSWLAGRVANDRPSNIYVRQELSIFGLQDFLPNRWYQQSRGVINWKDYWTEWKTFFLIDAAEEVWTDIPGSRTPPYHVSQALDQFTTGVDSHIELFEVSMTSDITGDPIVDLDLHYNTWAQFTNTQLGFTTTLARGELQQTQTVSV